MIMFYPSIKKKVKFLALGVGTDAHKLKNRVLIWEKLRKQGLNFLH